jgi:hypothetical protein
MLDTKLTRTGALCPRCLNTGRLWRTERTPSGWATIVEDCPACWRKPPPLPASKRRRSAALNESAAIYPTFAPTSRQPETRVLAFRASLRGRANIGLTRISHSVSAAVPVRGG